MAYLNPYAELDELGDGHFRQTHYLRPVAYRDGGSLRGIVNDWQNGDATWPHIITAAPMLIYTAADGMRRICPTRQADRYIEIGAPYIKPASKWNKVALGTPTRTGNRLQWTTTNANVYVDMAGHYVKLAVLLKGGWLPPNNQFAFPVGLSGLTRSGGAILQDGVQVASIREPVVYDYAHPDDIRPIAWQFVSVSGQVYALFTLPDLAGMAQPLIDPDLVVQPDATAGKDARIDVTYATWNWGINTLLIAGERNDALERYSNILIQFDLTDVPASFQQATLSLYCNGDYASVPVTMNVYRIKRAWVEGTRAGADDSPATGATWTRYDTTNSWQAAGGFGDDDADKSSIGTIALTAAETLNEFKNISLTPTTKATLDLGNGWHIRTLMAGNDAYSFASSDDTTAANRPKLSIDYTVVTGSISRAPFWGRF